MKTLLTSTALIMALSTTAFAAGTHDGDHSYKNHEDADHTTVQSAAEHGHTEGHEHSENNGDHHQKSTVGSPGTEGDVTRIIEVSMIETDDGDMIFSPAAVDVALGETIRFAITNAGELEHEFVLDTVPKNAEHKALMEQFPEMEHDDPNSIRLEAAQTGEIIWSFTNAGSFEFACLIPGHYEAGMHSDVVVANAQVQYTKGVVKKVNAESGKVTIIHEELLDLGMPAMTMVFRVADEAMLEQLEPGENIEFVAERLKGKITVTDVK